MLGVPNEASGRLNLSLKQERLIQTWSEHPWNFMAGRTDTGDPLLWTKDERDPAAPLKPFPTHLRYLQELVEVIHYETRVAIDKSRQMYVTTLVLLYCHWFCLFNRAAKALLSKNKLDEAKELLRDKIRFPHSTMPIWAQAALPISKRPQKQINYPHNIANGGDSHILGAPQNVAEREARGGTYTIVLIDEAARQAGFGAIVAGAGPATYKIIAPTTPELGNQGAADFKAILDDVLADTEHGESATGVDEIDLGLVKVTR